VHKLPKPLRDEGPFLRLLNLATPKITKWVQGNCMQFPIKIHLETDCHKQLHIENLSERTGKARSRKLIFHFWAANPYTLASEDSTYAHLFMDMVSREYQKLLKIIRAVFESTAIMFVGTHVNGFQFFSWNVQITRMQTQEMDKLLNTEYDYKLSRGQAIARDPFTYT
jgi:hypothetical protein